MKIGTITIKHYGIKNTNGYSAAQLANGVRQSINFEIFLKMTSVPSPTKD
jgi:hypothetical protein